MNALVLRKEWLALVRDGRLAVLCVGLLVLLAGLTANAAWQHQRDHAQRDEAQQATRQQWDNQGDKHPHRGAHYGLYVFRPFSGLSAIEPGLVPYTGQALWLEPHRRNMARYSPAADETATSRLGRFTAGFALYALLPLLVVGLAFTSLTQEREQGTLRMLHSAGLSVKALLVAKFAVLAGVSGTVLLLAMALGAGMFGLVGFEPTDDPGSLSRLALLGLSGFVYCCIFAVMALALSAWLATSRMALLAVLAMWVAFVWVVPRVSAGVAAQTVALPSHDEFWAAIRRDYEQGLPGDGPLTDRVKRFEADTMARYGVTRVEDLPVGINPMRRLFRDAYADKVHALHFADLWGRYARQENQVRWFAVLSPTVAMRAVAMASAGTDLAHQRHFEEAADAYRRSINTAIDQWEADSTQGVTSFESKFADDSLWQSMPTFRYAPPPPQWAWKQAWVPLLTLLAWLVGALVLLRWAAKGLTP